MNIVFAGTPEFAAVGLRAIVHAAADESWNIPLVFTQPDRPSGRGLKLAPSAVKQVAQTHGIDVCAPASLRKGDDAVAAHARLKSAEPDVLIVAAYGLILPQSVLDIPGGLQEGRRFAAINIHASLLPRWRGAAPVVRAVEAGDSETGVTLMQMDAGLDTGAMLMRESIAIAADDTAGTLTGKLAQLGARMIVDALRAPESLTATPQPDGATYAHKVGKSEAAIDWSSDAAVLERKLRAFDPFPVAASELNGTIIRVWRAQPIASTQPMRAGVVLQADSHGIRVACGAGELLITELQRPGGKRVPARGFLAGFPIRPGDRFVSATSGPLE